MVNVTPYECDAQKLRAALDVIHDKKRGSGESSQKLSKERKEQAERLGCERDALALIERVDGMSEEKRADFLRTFVPMFEALMPDWEDKMRDMVDQAQAINREMEASVG